MLPEGEAEDVLEFVEAPGRRTRLASKLRSDGRKSGFDVSGHDLACPQTMDDRRGCPDDVGRPMIALEPELQCGLVVIGRFAAAGSKLLWRLAISDHGRKMLAPDIPNPAKGFRDIAFDDPGEINWRRPHISLKRIQPALAVGPLIHARGIGTAEAPTPLVRELAEGMDDPPPCLVVAQPQLCWTTCLDNVVNRLTEAVVVEGHRVYAVEVELDERVLVTSSDCPALKEAEKPNQHRRIGLDGRE